MANKAKFEVGQNVTIIDDEGETRNGPVTSVVSGWVTVTIAGVEYKRRAKDVESYSDIAELAPVAPVASETDADTIEAGEDEGEEESGNVMANTIKKFAANYKKTVTPCGKTSINNGDLVAVLLAPLDYEDVMILANEFCELGVDFCQTKYSLLNNGQKRMNSGNRIRARVKKSPDTFQILQELSKAFLPVVEAEATEEVAA